MPKFCPACGEKISDTIKFCTSCGAPVSSGSAKTGDKNNEQTPSVDSPENFQPDQSVGSKEPDREHKIRHTDTPSQQPVKKNWKIVNLVLGIFVLALIAFVLSGGGFIQGNFGNTQSTGPGSNPLLAQSGQSNPVIPIPTENPTQRNISIANQIVADYHKTHIYSLNDMYVCVDMSSDVWDMLKARGINAKINVGNVKQNITDIKDSDHAWVLAEVAPNSFLALETTGGYSVKQQDNPLYYKGWSFANPKGLKEYLDKLKHPCQDGYVLGSDNLCHEACGGSHYCSGNGVCVNGQCKVCDSGYILGDDMKCHQPCGGTSIYCTGGSVCVNGQCRGCDPGYILGDDMKCHQPCGSTTKYCTGDSICVNGQCRGCSPGYYLGTDFQCHKS